AAARALITVLDSTKNAQLSMVALKQRWRKAVRLPQSHFYRALQLLRQEGFVTVFDESSQTQAPKVQSVVILTGQEAQSPRHKQLVDVLARHGGQLPLKELVEEAGTTHATVKRLVSEGLVCMGQEEVLRDPLEQVKPESAQKFSLTEHQEKALSVLRADLLEVLSPNPPSTETLVQPWLLYGVTGSGKTEIYLQLIEDTLKFGRSAMLLVPEISLTPQLARRLKSRFGDKVSVWHSALSDGERYDTWRRLRSGDVRVLLGARSAVLANLPDL